MNKSDFYFDLPKELIAQTPIKERDTSKLMVVDKCTGEVDHKNFKDILSYLRDGDCLVLNNTKVLPARLFGSRENTGGKVEFLLLKRVEGDKWETLVKPGKKARPGDIIVFGNGILKAEILELGKEGSRIVEFKYDGIFEEILDELGSMPLPPYITETLSEKERYQTVYAKEQGSAAAPTAGLHFTKELMEEIEKKGVKIAYVTLHVGLGTFRPVKVDKITEHDMHEELYIIDETAANIINTAKSNGKRVITVGTTSTRTLESAVDEFGKVKAESRWTNIFIYPGYEFKIIDGMVTNFHLPESTLIMLISALVGREKILDAYEKAIENRYRFFSFGDAMFII